MSQVVLVTGGSGFVAGHTILQLLEQGYDVRTSVRSLSRESDVRTRLEDAGMRRGDALTFVEADLTRDDGWSDAVRGVDFVLHVASPVMPGTVPDENDVIGPAREGTLRVLRAARDEAVKRVAVTSAFHAVGFGQGQIDHVFTEDDWSPLDGPGMDAYGRSKVLAERAAWEFIRSEGGGTELTTLLPVATMGPAIGQEVSGANGIVQRMLSGQMRGYPNLFVPVVDVRDVAAAHVAAMTAPGAAGQRVLVTTGEPAVALKEMGALLRSRLGGAAQQVPTRSIPDLVVRLGALFSPSMRSVVGGLGYVKRVSDDKLRSVLGVAPRPAREAIVASGESLVAKGLA